MTFGLGPSKPSGRSPGNANVDGTVCRDEMGEKGNPRLEHSLTRSPDRNNHTFRDAEVHMANAASHEGDGHI